MDATASGRAPRSFPWRIAGPLAGCAETYWSEERLLRRRRARANLARAALLGRRAEKLRRSDCDTLTATTVVHCLRMELVEQRDLLVHRGGRGSHLVALQVIREGDWPIDQGVTIGFKRFTHPTGPALHEHRRAQELGRSDHNRLREERRLPWAGRGPGDPVKLIEEPHRLVEGRARCDVVALKMGQEREYSRLRARLGEQPP